VVVTWVPKDILSMSDRNGFNVTVTLATLLFPKGYVMLRKVDSLFMG
jgi:hypothetical protein